MRVTSIALGNFRSFASMRRIDLGPINVLIGANNSGKTSILRALSLLQVPEGNPFADVRIGATHASIHIGLADIQNVFWGSFRPGTVEIIIQSGDRRNGSISRKFRDPSTGQNQNVSEIPAVEPHHFIVPYLSKRKVMTYQEDVRHQYATTIASTMTFLAAKLSRIGNPDFPGSQQYRETCREILGFVVTSTPSEGGQRPGVYLPDRQNTAH